MYSFKVPICENVYFSNHENMNDNSGRRLLYLGFRTHYICQSWSVEGDKLELSFGLENVLKNRYTAFVYHCLYHLEFPLVKGWTTNDNKSGTKGSEWYPREHQLAMLVVFGTWHMESYAWIVCLDMRMWNHIGNRVVNRVYKSRPRAPSWRSLFPANNTFGDTFVII